MKIRFILFLGLMVLAVFLAAPASFAASALDAKKVEKFVGSISAVNALSATMKEEGKQEALQADMDVLAGDDFRPYTNSVVVLKEKFPGDYAKLGGIVKQHGFSSQDEWAGVGDAVMISYMAIKAEETAPGYDSDMGTELTPEIMAQLPPESRAQVEKTMKMMKALRSAPAENKAAVTPFVASIDKLINEVP